MKVETLSSHLLIHMKIFCHGSKLERRFNLNTIIRTLKKLFDGEDSKGFARIVPVRKSQFNEVVQNG